MDNFDKLAQKGDEKAIKYVNQIFNPYIFNIENKINDKYSPYDYVAFVNGNTGTTGYYIETKDRTNTATGYTHFVLESDKIEEIKKCSISNNLPTSSFFYLNTFNGCDWAYLWNFNTFKYLPKGTIKKSKEELSQAQINLMIEKYGENVIIRGKKWLVEYTATGQKNYKLKDIYMLPVGLAKLIKLK